MPTRKGLGAGKGKGFKNIIGQDPMTHSMNARGIKSKVPLQPIKSKKTVKVNKNNLVDFIIEYESGNPTLAQTLELFSYLIKTGQAYSLQGMYGRQATRLIEEGLIDKDGTINYDKVDELDLENNIYED